MKPAHDAPLPIRLGTTDYAARATEIATMLELPARVATTPHREPKAAAETTHVRYIEDKIVDWARVQQILALSERARQWANFGPVSLALERALEHVLALPPDRAVVACASGTLGLQALAGLRAARRGRNLRWVVCDYTFFCQRTGPFADAVVVDCAEDGMIDLEAVATLPEDSWDGLVATNLFAGLVDTRKHAAFCADRGKSLILDSAAALFGPDRSWQGHPDEAISFHHTKPWGLGEGGCVIVGRADAADMRALLNFGIGGPASLRRLSSNAKISDIACAPILDRLERLPHWMPEYQAQRARIEGLCARAGLPLLLRAPEGAVLSNVPILARVPAWKDALDGFGFDVGKYYPPLGSGGTARRLFDRIANIPAHRGMAAVPSEAVSALLERLA